MRPRMLVTGLNFDFFDFDDAEFLAVADGLVIALAPFHLKSEFLFASDMLDYVGHHSGICDRGRADAQFAVIIDEQHSFKSVGLAGLGGQALDLEGVAGCDSVLLASG